MPSGSKKRKATKKKMETKPNYHSATTSQGNEDLKIHDEKESTGVDSPTYQERHHQLAEAFNNKSMEGSEIGSPKGEISQKSEEVEEVVQVIRERKFDEDSESRSIDVECVQILEESHDLSSSSSSDDESSSLEKNSPMASKKMEEDCSSVMEIVPSVEPIVFLSEEVNEVVEVTSGENFGTSDLIDLVTKIEEDELPFSDQNAGASGVSVLASNENEDMSLPSLDAPQSNGTSNGHEHREEYGNPESSVTQPLLDSTPPIVQPTSWKSCCGLFDILRGANR